MISLELGLDEIHADWRDLWSESLPGDLRGRVFADARLREDLGRRIANSLGAKPVAGLRPSDHRDFLALRAGVERPSRLAGLLLFVEPLARAVERADVERLFADFGREDATLALRLRPLRPADGLDLVLPDSEAVKREGRAALRAWIETLPAPLADRATLMLPREPDPVFYGFSTATRVAVAKLALKESIEEI